MSIQPLVKPPVETDVDLMSIIAPYEKNQDPERKTHIVTPDLNMHIWQPGMSSRDVVNLARMSKKHVVALCGYRWVPVHNPADFDTCDPCIEEAGIRMREES